MLRVEGLTIKSRLINKQLITNLEQKLKITIPNLALLLILGLLPLFDGGIDHNATYYLFMPALVAALWLLIGRNVALQAEPVLPFTIYGLFLLWSAVSIIWSIAPHRTFIEFLQLGLYGSVFFIATYTGREGYFRIGRVILLAGVLLVVHGILQNLILGITTVTSTILHHNPFGIYMVMLYFCAWGYYLKHENRTSAVAAVIFLIGLFISGSRGSLVALFLALPLLLTAIPRDRQKVVTFIGKTAACLLIAFIVATIIISIPPVHIDEALEEQISGILGRPDYLAAQNIFARFAYWEVGYNVLQTELIRGYGLGTFFSAYLLEDLWPSMHYSRFAHNHFIQTFAETGLIGFLLFLAFVGSLFYVFLKNRDTVKKLSPLYPGTLSALLAFLIHITIDFTWNIPAVTVLFFSLLGVLLGSYPSISNSKISVRPVLLPILIMFLLLNTWHIIAFNFYNEAIKQEASGNYQEAVTILDSANLIYPINARAYYLSANNRLELYTETENEQHLDKALKDANKALSLSPYDTLSYKVRSKIYFNLEKAEAAREDIYLSFKYTDIYYIRYLNLATQRLQSGDISSAKSTASNGLAFAEQMANYTYGTRYHEKTVEAVVDFHLILAEVFEFEGDYEQAEKHLQKVKEIMPEHPEVTNRN